QFGRGVKDPEKILAKVRGSHHRTFLREGLVPLLEDALGNRQKEVLLVVEMPIERTLGYPGGTRDPRKRSTAIAVGCKQIHRGIDQTVVGRPPRGWARRDVLRLPSGRGYHERAVC